MSEEPKSVLQFLPAGTVHTQAQASVAYTVLVNTEVTNLQAARIINLPSSSVPATSFFSEQSGPDKLVWR